MGWSPVVTTHTSDYFPVFYAMALELIDNPLDDLLCVPLVAHHHMPLIRGNRTLCIRLMIRQSHQRTRRMLLRFIRPSLVNHLLQSKKSSSMKIKKN